MKTFKVQRVEILDKEEEVWDLTISGDHTFFAEGVLVHNCYGCGRQYTSADYIDLILGKPIKDFLESKFDKKTLDMMVRSSGEFEIKVESFPIQDYLGELEVSLESFLRKVYKC